MLVLILSPLDKGTGESLDIAQVVIDGFEGHKITDTGIRFTNVTVVDNGVDGRFLMMTVNCEFRYDVIK